MKDKYYYFASVILPGVVAAIVAINTKINTGIVAAVAVINTK